MKWVFLENTNDDSKDSEIKPLIDFVKKTENILEH